MSAPKLRLKLAYFMDKLFGTELIHIPYDEFQTWQQANLLRQDTDPNLYGKLPSEQALRAQFKAGLLWGQKTALQASPFQTEPIQQLPPAPPKQPEPQPPIPQKTGDLARWHARTKGRYSPTREVQAIHKTHLERMTTGHAVLPTEPGDRFVL